MPSMPMQSGMAAQYGGNQYASQQAAAPSQAPITGPARPQQATQASTYSTTPYNRPSAQPRMTAATAAAAPAFGRPSVQAPAGNRANAITRPGTQLAAAKPGVPAAPAGKANLHRPLAASSQQPLGGRAMAFLSQAFLTVFDPLSCGGSRSASAVSDTNRVGTQSSKRLQDEWAQLLQSPCPAMPAPGAQLLLGRALAR